MNKIVFTDPSAWRQDLSLAPKLGCPGCPDFGRCGGLRVRGDAIDCTHFCDCKNPKNCDRACRLNPYFVQRSDEVGGLHLQLSSEPSTTEVPYLDGYAPLLYHGSKRTMPCNFRVIAIPFFVLFERRTGNPRFLTRNDLARSFKIFPESIIVASATAKDGPLERWWILANKRRVYDNLRDLKIDLVTTPNYSVFNNVPYWDNWYNQKRGILSWAELMLAGIPSALHINAHTVEDYRDFLEFIKGQKDLSLVSVEFGTGMGHPSRIHWHARELCNLAQHAGRPLGIVTRGGISVLPQLHKAFSSVLYIDTHPFVKTQQRQRAFLGNDLQVKWAKQETLPEEPLDARLAEAIDACERSIKYFSIYELGTDASRVVRRATNNRSYKSRDTGDLKQLSLFLPHLSPVQHQGMISTPEAKKRVQII